MAFVPALPVSGCKVLSLPANAVTGVIPRPSLSSAAVPRMGYGDYSFSTDRTHGHVQNYYVDKFRVASDFARGRLSGDEADSVVGRDGKGGVKIPDDGIPQEIDPLLLPDGPAPPGIEFTEDPRLAEASGAVYPWDAGYKDPRFENQTFANPDDEEVGASAMRDYANKTKEERFASLMALNPGYKERMDKLLGGK